MKEKIVFILIIILVAAIAEYDGYHRFRTNAEKAAITQKADDKTALIDIKEKQAERKKHYEQSKAIIQAVPDPAGCVHSPVPSERIDRLYNLYSYKTRPGIVKAD